MTVAMQNKPSVIALSDLYFNSCSILMPKKALFSTFAFGSILRDCGT